MKRGFALIFAACALVFFVWIDGPQRGLVAALNAPMGRQPSPVSSTCASPCQSPPIGVRSFNVLCSFCGKEGYDDWDARVPHLQDTIFRHNPDLIGLQELVGSDEVADIFGANSPYTMVAWSVGDWIYADSALFYRTARFKALDSGEIWASKKPMLPLSRAWTPSFPRLIQWVLLEDFSSGATFLFANTHLDNNGENKPPAAALFGDSIPSMAAHVPVIATGDFNTHVNEARFSTIRGVLLDAFSLVDEVTLSGQHAGLDFTRPELFPDRRIDHILVSDGVFVRGVEHAAPVYGTPLRRPSDHPTIYAEVVLDR